ncbi:hypothetical protein FJZ39_03935 [Candidatus Saccharibacteria bacterium]|nr:hypothetical protein [Candidatus Saccharibacteria bacterium]
MKTNIPVNCGNSPRSLLAIEIAVNLASNKYDKLEPLLAEYFTWCIAGSNEKVPKSKLKSYMDKVTQSKIHIDKYDILTSISHGKYAAVSSCAYASNGYIFNSHDLYEFTGAGASAKLLKVTSYIVGSKH